MLSKKAKYAFKALEYIARHNDRSPLFISEIAEKQRIPRKFLELILLELKKEGVLGSRLGKQGGYYLEMPASEITFGRIVRLIDGPIAMLPCVSTKEYKPCADCKDEKTCGLRHILARAREATTGILDQVTISDMLASEDILRSAILN